MAATRPSIMSEGATISAPARACETAAAASHSSVVSLSTSPLTILPQCPWLVYSQLQTSVMTSRPRHLAPDGADGALHDAVVGIGAGGHFVLGLGQAEQDDAADAKRVHLGAFLDDFVDGKLEIAGHGADFAADALAGAGKQGQDELRRGPDGFRVPELRIASLARSRRMR